MAEPKQFSTSLAKVNETFFPMIERQLNGNGVIMDGYSKQCVLSAIGAINAALSAKGISWGDKDLDTSTITEILQRIACLKLNASASPREVYFQTRNVKSKVRDPESGREVEVWKKQVEMGIEGDGNDGMLARFGRDVKKVGQFWLVREHDTFEYPQYTGFDVIPPKWIPTGKGEVIRVVYPILKTDGTVEFHIAERDDVVKNLIAHISNNMMNETFGICGKRFDATDAQKKQIDEKKKALLKKAKELGLAALEADELQKWISPAWSEYQSREAMMIRKMRNNIVKKIPKDFGNAFIEMTYDTATDETAARVHREITEHANGEIIDIEPEARNEQAEPDTTPDVEQQPKPEAPAIAGQSEAPAQQTLGPDF